MRRGYLETLDSLRDKNLIKAVTGARRVGKSTLLAQYRDALAAKMPGAPILYINFDEPEYRFLAEKGKRLAKRYRANQRSRLAAWKN
jgi:predicted AAA+ superfamily ATPase